jgi:hypothetical protein
MISSVRVLGLKLANVGSLTELSDLRTIRAVRIGRSGFRHLDLQPVEVHFISIQTKLP